MASWVGLGPLFLEFSFFGELVGEEILDRKEEVGVRSTRSVCDMVGVTTEVASLVSKLIENRSAGMASGLELGDKSVFCGEEESDIGDERGGEVLRAVMPSWPWQSRAPVSNWTFCSLV